MAVSALPPNATLVKGLTVEQKDLLASAARLIKLARDECLFRLAGEAKALYVVKSGVVALSMEAPVGGANQRIVMVEASPGETIGWSALVPPHKYTLDAHAAVDSSLVAIDREALLTVCEAHPELGRDLLLNLVTTMGRRLHVLHAMWVRELRRNLEREYPGGSQA